MKNNVNKIGSCYFNVYGPFMIAFDITNKCNFKCLHCHNSSGCGNLDLMIFGEINNKDINMISKLI